MPSTGRHDGNAVARLFGSGARVSRPEPRRPDTPDAPKSGAVRFFLPREWRVVEPALARHADGIRGVHVRDDGTLCVELLDDTGFVAWRPDPIQVETLLEVATGRGR